MGNEAALAHLRTLKGGSALRAVEWARPAVVRFTARARSTDPPGTVTSGGSGVLVNGGRHLLVAGHVLVGMEKYSGLEFSAVMADGRRRRGRVPAVRGGIDGAPEGDWGLVELEDPPPEGCPSLRWGKPAAEGTTVVMLGYSGGFGVAPEGAVSWMGSPEDAPLLPLAFVGRVTNAVSCTAEVVAGMKSGGGSSGGAVIDLEGNLVGVMATTRWAHTTGTMTVHGEGGKVLLFDEGEPLETYWFEATPVSVFRRHIEGLWKR
jgi:hypothetical protein